MFRAFLWPTENVGLRDDLEFGGPGVVAILAEEFAFKATERRKDGRNSAPKKMPAELGKFDAR